VLAPGVQHADGLRALAGKDESKGFHGENRNINEKRLWRFSGKR